MRVVFAAIAIFFAAKASAADRPNIIFMLADDQAWHGTSVLMHPDVKGSKSDSMHTPNLEKLAAQGMRFSAAYAPAPVCSPTRISLQTGKSPARLHWTKAAPPEPGHKLLEPVNIKNLSDRDKSIGEILKGVGYATAHYGKWHIRGGGPGKHGYDEHDGDTGNEEAFKFTDPNPVDIFGMSKRAAVFMEKSNKSGKPFYIQLSWNALHAPGNANKATLAKYQKMNLGNEKRTQTAAITEDLDTGVGEVLKAVKDLGLEGNTYVIYMSDNGGGGGRSPLNGGKGDVYEGGIRVPFMIRGPGIPANSWSHVRIVGYDLFPTFCDWAGIASAKQPRDIEGGSIVPLLKDGKGDVKRSRDELVFHFPHYQGSTPHSAIIVGDLKLMKYYEYNNLVLFDLSKDLREQNDLSKKMPQDTSRLHKRLTDHLVAIDAQMPTINTKYDPISPSPLKKSGKGKGDK